MSLAMWRVAWVGSRRDRARHGCRRRSASASVTAADRAGRLYAGCFGLDRELGAEGRMIPAWPGAPDDKFGFTGFPLFSIRKDGTPPDYFGPRDSFGFPHPRSRPVQVRPGRQDRVAAEVHGLRAAQWLGERQLRAPGRRLCRILAGDRGCGCAARFAKGSAEKPASPAMRFWMPSFRSANSACPAARG